MHPIPAAWGRQLSSKEYFYDLSKALGGGGIMMILPSDVGTTDKQDWVLESPCGRAQRRNKAAHEL